MTTQQIILFTCGYLVALVGAVRVRRQRGRAPRQDRPPEVQVSLSWFPPYPLGGLQLKLAA